MSYSGIVKRAKQLRKSPSRAAGKRPFPSFDPEYPVKPWLAHTGERFSTVSVRLDDGRYLAFILESPNIRHTARTRSSAEDAVKQAYPKHAPAAQNPRNIPYDDEEAFMDDEDYRIGQERIKRGKFLTLEQFRAWRKNRRKR